MWWLIPTALAGALVPPVLGRCDDPLPAARSHWEAEGLPPGAVALELIPGMMCCTAWIARPVDAAGNRLPGSLFLNDDCSLIGASTDGDLGPASTRFVGPLRGPPATGPTGAAALKPAYAAMRDRSGPGDLVVAVRTGGGWEVWLVRPNEHDILTVARAELDPKGQLLRIVDEVKVWTPPPSAEAARTVRSMEPEDR